MGKGTLRKKLAKGKHKVTVPISIRLPVQTTEILDQIEQATELNYDWWLRMLAEQLARHWQENGNSITVPLKIAELLEPVKKGKRKSGVSH